jgi:hypothetical protein
MTHPLTTLQQAVVERLRSFGHIALAEEAHDAWTRGDRLFGYQLGRSVGDGELAADFARANSARADSTPTA